MSMEFLIGGFREGQTVEIKYRNHRGEIGRRLIEPINLWYGTTEFYTGPRFFLSAIAHDRGCELRDFALDRILPR